MRGGSTMPGGDKTLNNGRRLEDDPWSTMGGGAINEKQRHYKKATMADPRNRASTVLDSTSLSTPAASNFDPSNSKSHLWHALEGLDRYPNYLSRWSVDDMDSLEHALEVQITKVRQQRAAVVERRVEIKQLVEDFIENDTTQQWRKLIEPPASWQEVRDRILDPEASKAIFGSKVFAGNRTHPADSPPTVSQVMSGQVKIDLDASQLATLMDEELFDVFSFRLLSLPFCRQVREFTSALVQFGKEHNDSQYAALLVGRRPVDLDTVGFDWLNNLLFHLVVRPISRQLFQTSETGGDLDWRHGYIAGYSAQPAEGKARERLVTHTDDSEVTLNICLGDEGFQGGLLEFRGLRGTDSGGELIGTFQPQPGLALIHAGRHFHHVTTVTSGDRFAYIIWARSWQGIRSQACPCCWLNRRRDTTCVCGERWN